MRELETIVQNIHKIALQNNLKIGTAESCTGGKIAATITELPGVSAWFSGAIVSYANSVKLKTLKVDEQTLKQNGAVSAEVVCQMLNGACEALNLDIAIAVSGIAGPDGGSELKPVGLVYIGVGDKHRQQIEKYNFSGDRKSVQKQAVISALSNLQNFLQKFY